MISVGRMAEKYGMLPSEVVAKANTYDLMITDVVATYDNYQQAKASGKPLDNSVYRMTDDDLIKIAEKHYGKQYKK